MNDYTTAKTYFDSAIYHVKGVGIAVAKAVAASRNYYVDENLIRENRLEDAMNMYKNLLQEIANGPFSAISVWELYIYKKAQLADQLGKKEEAVAYYNILKPIKMQMKRTSLG